MEWAPFNSLLRGRLLDPRDRGPFGSLFVLGRVVFGVGAAGLALIGTDPSRN
nr:hypothetical protein [Nitrosomonas nitrosa]